MSNINRTYLTHQGVRKQPTNHFVGVDGAWKKIRYRLIAVNGAWVEVYDNENNLPGTHGFLTLNKRSAYPGELIELTGGVLETYPEVDADASVNGFYYPLFYDFNEASTHGRPSARLLNINVQYNLNLNGKGVQLTGQNVQAVTIPVVTAGGIDLPTLMGETGGDEFHISFQFKLAVQPYPSARVYLFYAGIPGERLVIYYDTAKRAVCLLWEDGDTSFDTVGNMGAGDIIEPGNIIGVYFSKFLNSKNYELSVSDSGSNRFLKYNGSLGGTVQGPKLTYAEGMLNYGIGYESINAPVAKPYFASTNTHADFTILTSQSLKLIGDVYRTAQPGQVMHPGTGLYVMMLRNIESYDLQLGVGEPGANLSLSAANSGWCINTLGLNKFNHQSNGGAYLRPPIASVTDIGMAYNSDNGSLHYFTDGEMWEAFPAGSITVGVKLLISGRGNVGQGKEFNIEVALAKGSFTTPLTASSYREFPKEYESSVMSILMTAGTFRNIFVTKGPITAAKLTALTAYDAEREGVNWLVRSIVDTWGFKQNDDNLINVASGKVSLYVPATCPPNTYLLRYATPRDGGWPDDKHITIHPLPIASEDLNIDFTTSSAEEIRSLFLRWDGGDFVAEPHTSGGTVWDKDNVTHEPANGGVVIKAQASAATFDSTGRSGGKIVTRFYYGPGSYRMVVKLPVGIDVLTCFLTRQFEEGIEDSGVYKAHRAEYLAPGIWSGKRYTTRRHGVGVELPSALFDADDIEVFDYNVASFTGQHGANPADINTNALTHGKQLNDGLFHEIRFDWHSEPELLVDFYIDGVLVTSIIDFVPEIIGRLHVGLWFPWKSNTWRNKVETLLEEQMIVKSISITRYQETVRAIGETYPNRGLCDFFS